MLKNLLFTFLLFTAFIQSISANNLPVKNQDVSPEQLKSQNKEITKLAAQQLSKNLPQVINKYTIITKIEAVGASLIYTYEINTGAKSDETVRAEDRTKWEEFYIQNVCQRSKRFLDAQVSLSYVYYSAKTKTKLFQFDVNQAKCFKIYGI
jgi:hypothetical protein